MNVQSINRININIPQPVEPAHQEKSIPTIGRNFTPVSYTTSDGGLFIGYYLNIHG